MRPKRRLRDIRPLHVAAGTMMLAAHTTAGALAAAQANAQNALQIQTSAHKISLGGGVRVSGQAPATDAGQRVELEYARAGSPAWRSLGSSTVKPGGAFRLHADVARSGLLRAVTVPATGATQASATGDTSQPEAVTVVPKFTLARHTTAVAAGHPAIVRGRLRPGVPGRRIHLLEHTGSGWHSVMSARTGRHGTFELRFRPAAGRRLRVEFAGDALNSARSASVGRVVVLHPGVASWYYDAGNTACGFHAGYGVANLSLPCGTHVTFRYGSRTVTATVDDRGPYVGGREWDLNQNTAAALGFAGVGTVWASR
jgi:hypothetical protein